MVQRWRGVEIRFGVCVAFPSNGFLPTKPLAKRDRQGTLAVYTETRTRAYCSEDGAAEGASAKFRAPSLPR